MTRDVAPLDDVPESVRAAFRRLGTAYLEFLIAAMESDLLNGPAAPDSPTRVLLDAMGQFTRTGMTISALLAEPLEPGG